MCILGVRSALFAPLLMPMYANERLWVCEVVCVFPCFSLACACSLYIHATIRKETIRGNWPNGWFCMRPLTSGVTRAPAEHVRRRPKWPRARFVLCAPIWSMSARSAFYCSRVAVTLICACIGTTVMSMNCKCECVCVRPTLNNDMAANSNGRVELRTQNMCAHSVCWLGSVGMDGESSRVVSCVRCERSWLSRFVVQSIPATISCFVHHSL